ncbi:MAG: type II secretion system protein GspL [Nitrospinota bacterium]|nr:type II secretion system protein GspL [Nitrospinota bacterium]
MKAFGVEAGPGFIRAAVVEKQLRGMKIIRLVDVSLGPDGRNSASLRDFLAQLGYNPHKDVLAAVFPGDKVTLRAMTTPLSKRSQISETLPFELESMVPLDADEFVCDYLVAGKDEKGSKILVTLAKNEDVESFVSIFQDAGLDPDLLAPGPLAAAAGLISAPNLPVGALAVSHAAADGTYLAVLGEERAPLTFHTSSAKGGDSEELGREIDKVVLGLGKDMPGLELHSIALGGRFPDMDNLSQGLGKRFMVQVGPAPIDDVPEAESQECPQANPAEKKALFLAALGAAFMAVEAAQPVNLRTGSLKKVDKLAGMNKEKLVSAALLALALVMWIVSFVGEGIGMNREYSTLKSEIRETFKAAMPGTTTIVSEKQQMLAERKRLENAVKALGVSHGRDPLLDILSDVSGAGPEGAKLDMENFTYEPGRLILIGRTDSFDKVDQFKNNLEKLPWVAKARLDKATTTVSKESVSFRIEVDVAL